MKLYVVVSSCGAFESHTLKTHGIFDDFDLATECGEVFRQECKDIFANRPDPGDDEYDSYNIRYDRELEFNNVRVLPYTLNKFNLRGE